LKRGHVTHINWREGSFNAGYVSNVTSLTARYSEDAQGELPDRLFLKMSRPDVHPELLSRGRHEVTFYQAMSASGRTSMLPHCYQAVSDENGASHILMDDLSETHFQKPVPIPPSNRHCEMIVESLAELHARWWNHPKLGNGLGEQLTEEESRASRE